MRKVNARRLRISAVLVVATTFVAAAAFMLLRAVGDPVHAEGGEGYLLVLTVYEDEYAMREAGKKGNEAEESARPNTRRIKEEIASWANESGLQFYELPAGKTKPEPIQRQADVLLRTVDNLDHSKLMLSVFDRNADVDGLSDQLSRLPSTSMPQVWSGIHMQSEGFHIVIPHQRVKIDGLEFDSPEDFEWNELASLDVANLDWHTEPLYLAYWSLDHSQPDRFGLGDIVRIEWLGDSVTIDTVVEDWGLSEAQKENVLDWTRAHWSATDGDQTYSVGFPLPPYVNESTVDVRAEFEQLLSGELPRLSDYAHRILLTYELRPDRWTTSGKTKASYDRPRQIADEAQKSVGDWLQANPEYQRPLIFSPLIWLQEERDAGLLTKLRLRAKTNDPSLLNELKELMSSVEWMPEPEIIFDGNTVE